MKHCIICGIPEITKYDGKIWLSGDNLCSICSKELKEREKATSHYISIK